MYGIAVISGEGVKGYYERRNYAECETFMINNPDCDVQLHYYEPAMDFCGDLNNHITISEEGKDFFCNDPVGQELDGHFAIIDMIEEEEEYQQDEVLATPPDVMEGTEFEEDV